MPLNLPASRLLVLVFGSLNMNIDTPKHIQEIFGGTEYNFTFPDNFMFGASSSSYQYEGAWNEGGKGESIWDRLVHTKPEVVVDGANGDVATDFYHKYKEDVQRIKSLGLSVFRFSISWTRIMPTGMTNSLNAEGINFYNDLINELIANDITPMVTMYHWDLPQSLQELGGWTNRIIVDYFEDYADVLFKTYGDRVKWWVTINEPTKGTQGYGGNETGNSHAPGVSAKGIGIYLAGHNMLLAHARAYHLYDQEYRPQQEGFVSILLESCWYEPLDNTSPQDHEATKQMLEYNLGWFANPIFSKEGDYPQILKERIGNNSKKEGFSRSRLPDFTKEEVELVRGTADYFGLNQYTAEQVTFGEIGDSPSFRRDTGVITSRPEHWPVSETTHWELVVPRGMRKTLKYIKDTYGESWKIFVTENGYLGDARMDDEGRMTYLATYMMEAWKAMFLDRVNLMGYLIWSLLDNFEWTSGYSERPGIFHVDFSDPNRTRTPRKSAVLVKEIATTRRIPKKYEDLLKEINDLEFD